MKKLYLGIFATALMSGSAFAHAVAPTIEPAAPMIETAPSYNTSAYDWDGFYAAFVVSSWLKSTGAIVGLFQGALGYNVVTSNGLLFGAEFTAGVWKSANSYGQYNSNKSYGWVAGAEARVGKLVDPNVLIYGSAGVETLGGTTTFGKVGVGLEVVLDDTFSIDIEYDYMKALDSSGISANSFGAGFIISY